MSNASTMRIKRWLGSGLLYNSNVLMYDRGSKPESLWSLLMTQGVSGPAADKSLALVPFELTSWKDGLERDPQTQVLSVQLAAE